VSKIPSHTDIKNPLLALLKRKREVSLDEALAYIAKKFQLSKAAQKQMQSCGREGVLSNRLRWARWELKREGKVVTPRRGFFRLA
jgi:restriction endonuclease Mrr